MYGSRLASDEESVAASCSPTRLDLLEEEVISKGDRGDTNSSVSVRKVLG